MATHYELTLTKDGCLIHNEWQPPIGDKEGFYAQIDKTKDPYSVLYKTVNLEPGFTIKNLFDIVEHDYEILNVLCHNCFITDYINYYKKLKNDGYIAPSYEYDPDGIEFMELYWYEEVYDGYIESTPKPHCHGLGWELRDDKKEDWGHWEKGTRIPWGITFTETKELLHLPLLLNEKFEIYDMHKDDRLVFKAKRKFTLFDLISGVFWELSFNGTPEDMLEAKKILDERIDEAKEYFETVKDEK